ncbi:MAG: hypothetical protein Q8O42_09660 [Acidobacteriota bacterium]|nr:hypothetical protein [Acidobacteriota bacterium]
MKKLALSKDLALPADEAATQKYGFIGRSGSGKSYAAMKLAELLLGAGTQVIALDWVGIWWSLRLAKNGKAPGFEHVYIFGGEHADVELQPESGKLMADLIVDKHISVVLDVMHFRKAERTRFATAFAEQFFHRKKTARTACHLFIEEAQAYLPQMVRGEEARMVGVFEDIGKVGRNYGIGNSLISQRPQAINKDVLNQVEVLLAFQTNGPQERKAIAGWTAENTAGATAMAAELPTLPVGDALVWSPQWLRIAQRVHIAERDTYNASSTPTSQAKTIAPQTLAKSDLEALGEEIKATVEKAKANDPVTLKKELAEAHRMLARMSTTIGEHQTAKRVEVADRKPQKVEVAVLRDGQLARAEALVSKLEKYAEDLTARGVSIAASFESFSLQVRDQAAAIASAIKLTRQPAVGHSAVNYSGNITKPAQVTRPQPVTRTPPLSTRQARPANADGIGKGQLAVLAAIAQHDAGVTREQLTVLTGYKRSSRDTYLQHLSQRGLIEFTGANISATAAGFDVLGPDFERLPTGAALLEHWRRELPQGERVILDAVVPAYPHAVTRDALSESTGYKRSSRDTYIQKLAARKLVEADSRGVTASALLFDGGR